MEVDEQEPECDDFTGQREPPLHEWIKGVLNRYPGGQIFKEIIQNADDAGAKEVHFYLDIRSHSESLQPFSSIHPELATRFEGPALLAYNDAGFTKKDWKSIQKPQQSGKRKDPFKVGKFGIGFNSVYNITDLPVIVSGPYLAFLEPFGRIWQGKTGERFKIADEKNMMNVFNGIGGFSTTMTSYDNRTLFRFPLRHMPSNISKECFTIPKLQGLVGALKEEAQYLLLFLRSVMKIRVFEINNRGEHDKIFEVSLKHSESSCESQRMFLERVSQIKYDNNAGKHLLTESIHETEKTEFTVECCNESKHYLRVSIVGSRSGNVWSAAKEQHVLPWVGCALELHDQKNIATHSESDANKSDADSREYAADKVRLFCFLPMPKETDFPLPVHVNGTFGLNDNRRSLKWPSKERIDDKTAEWNMIIIKDLLPQCYAELILEAIKLGVSHKYVYRAWPQVSTLENTTWSGLTEPLINILLRYHVFHSQNYGIVQGGSIGDWISLAMATFINHDQPEQLHLYKIVYRVLSQCGLKLVDVPCHIWKAIGNTKERVAILSPHLTRNELYKNQTSYSNLSAGEKLDLLTYILSDDQYEELNSLQLMPMFDRTFQQFNHDNFYVCSKDHPHTLLPNLQGHLVDLSSSRVELHEKLLDVARKEKTMLRCLDETIVSKLLPRSLPTAWKDKSIVVSVNARNRFQKWLEEFWGWVGKHNLALFEEQMVLPITQSSKTNRDIFRVTKMTKTSFTIRIRRTDCISPDLFEGLRNLGLYFINTLSPYFDHRDLGEYVQPFTARGVLTAVSNLYKGKLDVLLDEEQAERRHDVDTTKQADELRHFFDVEKLEEEYIQVLKYLPLFKRASNLGGYWSVFSASKYSWNKKVVYEENLGDLLPQTLYPPGMVVFSRGNHCKWLTHYFDEITMPNRVEFVLDYLLPIIASDFYPVKLLDELMVRLLQQLHTLKDLADKIQRNRLIEALSNLSFLRYDCEKTNRKPPNVLYDSRVEEVKTIFKDEPLFTLPPFRQPHILDFLHECHLRNTVTCQEIVDVICTISGKTTTIVEIERVKGILDCIQSHPDYLDIKVKFDNQRFGTLKECVAFVSENISWLPIEICPPSTYPKCLVWKGRSSSHSPLTSLTPTTFTCTEEQLLSSSYIAGSEVYIVKLPESINAIFKSTVKLPVECVIKHFKNVIKNCNDIDNKQLDDIVRTIYSFLQDNKQYTELVKYIVPGFKWIWIRKQHKFVSSSMVAMKTNHSLSIEPYFFFIENQEEFGELFEQLGVCKNISKSQVLSVLKEIHDLGKTSDCAWKAVMSILEWLSNNEQEEIDADAILYVPIETQDQTELKMEDSRNVCYTDMEFLTESFESTEENITLCHNEINKLGELLHLIPLSQKLGIADDIHEDVGQYESLACRIKNILRDYTDGITIVKELLQNADDAEATEVNLCYDARRHDVDPTTLVFSGMAKCNGPALVVHNNAVFKKEDFENIQKLAGATKKDKPLKIGKFGVGFCSVYHITDVPSFVSQEYLYIFDPTLQYLDKNIQDRSRPGKRLKYTGKIAAYRISKQLTPYIGLYGFESNKIYDGTMFRLPFRSSSSDLSSIMYTGNHIERLKENIKKHGSKLLLFLQNVKHITFSHLDEGDESPKIILDIHKETLQSPTVDTRILGIRVHTPTDTMSDDVCQWLVGFHAVKIDFNEQQRDATASVACLMQVSSPPEPQQYSVKPIEGEVFCFLPLALPSGIPCHVSANFAVSNNRKGIQSSEDHNSETNEAQWNVQLMKTVIPQAYLNMLQCLTELHAKECLTKDYPNNFYCLWPLKVELKTHDPWDNMLEHFYLELSKKKLLFSKYAQQWLKPSQSSFLSSKILSVTQENIPEVVHEIITLLNVKVVDIPLKYQKHIDQSTIMQELDFVKLVFEQIAELTQHSETRNRALLLFLQRCAQYTCDSPEKREFLEYLKNYECVPCTPNGEVLKHCTDIIDPRAFFAELYEPTDGKFPIEELQIDSVYSMLTDLGMISKRLPLEEVVERTTTIQCQSGPNTLQRTRLIFACLKEIFLPVKGAQTLIRHQALNLHHEQISELKAIKFVPVKQRPKHYPSALCWKGDDFTLLATNEIYYGEQCATLAGSQVCVVCTDMPEGGGCGEIDNCVISELGMRTTPQFTEVVDHFSHIIRKWSENLASFSTKWVTKVCSDIYIFIEEHLKKDPSLDLDSLSLLPCIWTESCFVGSGFVAEKWPQNGPYFFRLPSILIDKEKIKSALNIKINFTVVDLTEALNKLKKRFDCERVCKEYHEFVYTLVHELGMRMEEENWSDEKGLMFFLPDSRFVMRKANELEYNDAAQWCKSSSIQVHKRIPPNIAIKLGVRLTRAKLIESYEDSTKLFKGEDFGQSEKLTQRISNILRDYPLDITILKELLQNADDARASKMYVILDKRCHGTEKVPSDEWKDLQGPALLVWNDSTFSEENLRGIQRLGQGDKHSTAEKIGMFGIGFNVVYHLTDCPSFISAKRDGDSTFCVLDPHCRYIPGANKMSPGRRFNKIDERFWKLWSDLKPAYLQDNISELLDQVKFGSLFRFPLRHTKELMEKSKVADLSKRSEPLQPDSIEEKLTEWAPDMRDSLFFLNNVAELSFYVIDDNKVQHTRWYKVQITGDGQQSRARIQNNVNCFGKSDLTPHIERYTIILTDMLESNPTHEKWLVQQGVGDMEIPDNQWKYLPEMKPKHGIATPISVQRASNIQCRVFCFLPLPIFSHLPVHINGNFILDSSRRNLWQPTNPEKPDDQDQWNKHLFEAIASSYTQLLTSPELQTAIIDPSGNESKIPMLSYIKHYYDVFPKWLCDSPPEGQYLTLSRRIYSKLCQQNATVLVKLIKTDGNDTIKYTAIFLPLLDRILSQNQAYFYDRILSEEIVSITERIGMQLTEAPNFVYEHLTVKVPRITRNSVYEHLTVKVPRITRNSVYEYYEKFSEFVSPSESFPCLITATKFKSVERFKQFTEYLLGSSKRFPKLPIGVPLLLTADNQLWKFDISAAIRTKFSSIFSKSSDLFLHPDFIDVTYPEECFLNHSPYNHWITVLNIFSGALPEQLKCNVVLDASASLDSNLLQQLWNCLRNEKFFNVYLKHIIRVWALIPSTSNQLFSLNSKVLPVISDSLLDSKWAKEDIATVQNIISILEKLNMPFLDTKTVSPTDIREFCPLTSKPSTILKNLYYLHQEKRVLEDQIVVPLIKPLLEYFRNIHLAVDKELSSMIKDLPLFKTINGRLCSIPNGAFVWPADECVCETGMEKLLLGNKYVFLDADGDWTCLNANEALEIKPISPYEVYNKLIFTEFHELTEPERNVHLLNIRDILLVRAEICVRHHHKYDADAKLFVENIRSLNFLPKADETLGPAHAFADPRKELFKTFDEHFIFPPSSMQDDKWLDFLQNIGLQRSITTTKYLQFCSELAEGKHISTVSASHVLLEYLFQEKEWHEDKDFLDKVSKIDFVRVEPLPDVHWIHPCALPEKTIQDSDVVQQTSLAKAAEHKDYKLIWTVSSVVSLPSGGEVLLQKLHISTTSVEMVIENIRNISSSPLSDFHNFETYTCNRPAKGESVISVLYENFCFLKDNVPSGSTAEVLSALCSIPCIPVCAEGNVENIQRPVLVKPIQVIALPKNMVCQFKQYLSPLPKDMYSILPHVLALIGVEPAIMLKHVQGALETIHSVSRPDQPLDINTQEVVQCLLQKLYDLLDKPPKHEEGSCCLKQIYLPNSRYVLVDSQTLLYQDSEHYRKRTPISKESTFSELQLLVKKNEVVSTYKFNMKQLCNLLPTEIAPKPMSTSCRAVISTSCQVEASLSPLARGLQQAFSVPLLAAGACAILKHNSNPPDLCEKLKISLEQIFRNCEISTVRNLTVELWLDIKQPSEHIGTAEVDFNIKKEDASFKLHVNKDARKIFFFEALSTAVMTQAAEMNLLRIKDISKPQEALTYLLKVESSDDVRSTLREIGVHEDLNTDTSSDEYNAEFDPNLSPELGMPIPDSWHHRLQQDYNNLFRPQDWVGYEVQDEQIVFAQILYKNPDEEIFDSYFITIKSNEKKKVSVIYLYKILQSAGNEDHSLVLHEGSTKPEDMASNITITSVKKEICAELRRIWKLPEELKRKALKRMYLKWHPDKNPDNIELTEEAFKFLKRQIARLEAGKSLEDPDQEDDSSDSRHTTSSPFDDLFETWNRRARQHKQYKKREYNYYRRQRDRNTNTGAGSSRWGTSPNEKFEAPQPEPGTAQDWIRQAECDYETLLVLSKELHNHRQVCANACYLSYEVAEVSIMAGMFAVCGLRQRNRKRSHSIGNYAGALIQMEPSLTHGLQDHVKRVTAEEYNKRWPERGRPALNFTPEQAEQAVESALAIFEMMKNVVEKSQK